MSLMSALFHESQAKERAAEERRAAKYGGEQDKDAIVDLAEPNIPGVLTKKIVKPGNGEIPPVYSNVKVHYTGKLQDGKVFDTSVGGAPISFALGKGEVIRGWDYAVSTMQKEEKAIVTVGPNYGYGAEGSGPIPPSATLTFEMEIVGWNKPPMLEWFQWLGLVAMLVIIVYVLFVEDEKDILKKSLENPREL